MERRGTELDITDLSDITCVHLRDTFGRFLNISTEATHYSTRRR